MVPTAPPPPPGRHPGWASRPSVLYPPFATAVFTGWLMAQLPPSDLSEDAQPSRPVAVLVGRGAGDSCARTTLENATVTAAWLRTYHPGAPVLLITDPWQIPRATAAFRRQDLLVTPLAAAPLLEPVERNRMALRETAATFLYRLQGRL